jgi:hypothetical protein
VVRGSSLLEILPNHPPKPLWPPSWMLGLPLTHLLLSLACFETGSNLPLVLEDHAWGVWWWDVAGR